VKTRRDSSEMGRQGGRADRRASGTNADESVRHFPSRPENSSIVRAGVPCPYDEKTASERMRAKLRLQDLDRFMTV
jgi:hypothetical protein